MATRVVISAMARAADWPSAPSSAPACKSTRGGQLYVCGGSTRSGCFTRGMKACAACEDVFTALPKMAASFTAS